MIREAAAIAALDSVLPGEGVPPATLNAVEQLYHAVGPEMPDDLQSTPVKTTLPTAKANTVLKYNYDEGHAGRMSVPGTNGGSVDFKWVMDRKEPMTFMMQNLAFWDVDGKYTGKEECVIFVPGLNTVHQPKEGEDTTVDRMKHYTKVVGIGMTQLHIGTSFDQGEVRVNVSEAPMVSALVAGANLPGSVQPVVNDGKQMVWNERQIDNIQVGLSQRNMIDTPIKESLRRVMEESKEGQSVVLAVYSRGSMECEAALKKHIEDSKRHETDKEIEKRLRDKITVLTIGSSSAEWPDGPAYVHLAAWSDPLASSSGVTASNNREGAGKDAVFLNCGTPYADGCFDNHNFGACTSQYLGLVMKMSGAMGIRDLYDKAQGGTMRLPDDDMLRAMIQMTRGFEWLWNEQEAWKNIPMGALPTPQDAEALLKEKLGQGFVDRLVRNFGRAEQ